MAVGRREEIRCFFLTTGIAEEQKQLRRPTRFGVVNVGPFIQLFSCGTPFSCGIPELSQVRGWVWVMEAKSLGAVPGGGAGGPWTDCITQLSV